MTRKKEVKLILDTWGNYLGMKKGCIVLSDKNRNETRYPLIENFVTEIVLNSGNTVSTGVLVYLGMWETDVLFCTRYGRPIAMLKSLDDDCQVETRVAQYRALKNGKGSYLAKKFVIGKMIGQNSLLAKYGLETDDAYIKKVKACKETNLPLLRKKLLGLEGKFGRFYFKQIFKLFPEPIRPMYRSAYKAYHGVNNMLNLSYRILFWRCYRSLVKAHLEPYLGYLHKMEFGRPSMVCDFMELYRHLVDGFLIEYCQGLGPDDFKPKNERVGKKIGKRVYLKDAKSKEMVNDLFAYFGTVFNIPRVKRGKWQKLETLINEEAFRMNRYLRLKGLSWVPRIPVP